MNVKDLKQLIADLPDDMPLFQVNDYFGVCEPLAAGNAPEVLAVAELKFEHDAKSLFLPQNNIREGMSAHEVIREFDALGFN